MADTKFKIRKRIARFFYICLMVNFSFFLGVGIFHERISKYCFVIGVGLFLFMKIIEGKEKFLSWPYFNTSITKSIMVFIFVCCLSMIWSRNFSHSLEVFSQRYIPYFILFFMAYTIGHNDKSLKILVKVFMLGAFIVGIGGIIDLVKTGHFIRLFTAYGKEVLFVDYFLLTLPFFIAFAIFAQEPKIRILNFLGAIPLFVCFLFHYSRGGWLGFILAGLIVILIGKSINMKRKVLLVLASILVAFSLFAPFRKRLFSKDTLIPTAWADRVPMWETAVYLFQKSPLLGIGVGNYELYIYTYKPKHEFKEKKTHSHAHNTYLELLAETGILGLLSFLAILFIFFRKAFVKIRNDCQDPYTFAFTTSILAVSISELAGSSILVGVSSAGLFWFIFGLANARVLQL